MIWKSHILFACYDIFQEKNVLHILYFASPSLPAVLSVDHQLHWGNWINQMEEFSAKYNKASVWNWNLCKPMIMLFRCASISWKDSEGNRLENFPWDIVHGLKTSHQQNYRLQTTDYRQSKCLKLKLMQARIMFLFEVTLSSETLAITVYGTI